MIRKAALSIYIYDNLYMQVKTNRERYASFSMIHIWTAAQDRLSNNKQFIQGKPTLSTVLCSRAPWSKWEMTDNRKQ